MGWSWNATATQASYTATVCFLARYVIWEVTCKSVKLSIISDTHMRHEELGTLSGDVLIHCGDMFDLFERNHSDLREVDAWFSRQQFDLILCIGGNHDYLLEERQRATSKIFKNAIYLEDQMLVHNGITFYGTPWVPFLQSHAFHANDDELRERWSRIPKSTDILITHTPPAGVLDRSSRGLNLGCRHLTRSVSNLAPVIHCFGHVHASGGIRESGDTIYVNASSVDRPQSPLRRPIEIDV